MGFQGPGRGWNSRAQDEDVHSRAQEEDGILEPRKREWDSRAQEERMGFQGPGRGWIPWPMKRMGFQGPWLHIQNRIFQGITRTFVLVYTVNK